MQAFLDPAWYRVADLKPRLRAHVRVHRHHYRDQLWYVLQDNTTGRYHRFTPSAFQIVGRLDGKRTIDEIWSAACEVLEVDPPSQPECIRLLHQLHAADALQADISPDTEELLRRYQRTRRQQWLQQVRSPIFQRLPLVDPERFLERIAPFLRICFSPFGAVVWLLVVGAGLLAALSHGAELGAGLGDQVFDPANLVVLWLVFPFVKVLHELGHAAAVKVWGGEVHEMGVMFLVFSPVPYVDASSASAFADKRKRMVVGAAGMLVEVFIAAIAMLAWSVVDDGAVRSLCYNVMLIAGVTTLLFNGNPLLRFDAYYILADWLEMPNLAARSNAYLLYLLERYLFGVRHAESPATTPGERPWFIVYAVGSFAYRAFIYFVIASFLLTRFFFLGIALAAWAAISMVVRPLWGAIAYLAASSRIQAQRGRATAVSLALLASLLGAVLLVPVPLATLAEGIVWVPEAAIIRSDAEGFVERIPVEQGAPIARGDPVLIMDDPRLRTRLRLLEGELEAIQARYRNVLRTDRVNAAVTRQAMETIKAKLVRARTELAHLVVSSPRDGRVVVPQSDKLLGRLMRQGNELGFVLRDGESTIRAVVGQDDIGLVRERTQAIAVRLANRPATSLDARVTRIVPAASRELPSAALGTLGGGALAVDSADTSGRQALDKFFQLEIALGPEAQGARIGSRAWVRFDHGAEPLALRWYRGLRRLLLRQLDA